MTTAIYRILTGDCRDTLKTLPDNSVHCVVTSPPYYQLRRYLPTDHPDKHLEIGSEPTVATYVETLVGIFQEVRRALHPSGTVWLNVGDSYASQGGPEPAQTKWLVDGASAGQNQGRSRQVATGLKPKDLCLVPQRLIISLQDDGWWVRSVIVWNKRAPMPESITDRPTNSWEPIFLLTKSEHYFYDNEAVKEKSVDPKGSAKRYESAFHVGPKELSGNGRPDNAHNTPGMKVFDGTRNQRNVWTLSPEPSSLNHYASFPTEIPRRAIKAGTSEHGCCPTCLAPHERVTEHTSGVHNSTAALRQRNANVTSGGIHATTLSGIPGTVTTLGWQSTCPFNAGPPVPCTVLDPFGGSGTTAVVALSLGRNAILCELNEEYAAMTQLRIEQKATTNWQTTTGTDADTANLPLFQAT